jgi:hypothetical protein
MNMGIELQPILFLNLSLRASLVVFLNLSLRASLVVLYCKPESGKRWKDMNCGSGQQGRSMYSSFIYRLKLGFGRFFRRACNRFWNALLQEDTQIWANEVPRVTGFKVDWGCSQVGF